jgi:subtilisin family serine protease
LGCAPLKIQPDDPPADEQSDSPSSGSFSFAADADPEIAALPFESRTVIARILPGAATGDLNEAYETLGVTILEELTEVQSVVLDTNGQDETAVAAAASEIDLFEEMNKSYEYEVQQTRTPNDPEFSSQGYFDQIRAADAWGITTGSEDILIAIVDTGVELDHPDLFDKLVPGWNIYDDNNDPSDVFGHGTSVAGSAAAVSDNRSGVAGVAWDNPILPVRVSDERGRASSRNIASGIIWAVNRGAKIINVSFAPIAADRTILAAAAYARSSGALVFISTGNNGRAFSATRDDSAIFVGAVDDRDELASFSNTGLYVDLVAPGTRIRTTKTGRGYGNVNGTSFASPIAAGVAALVWSVNPDFRPTTVQDILMSTTIDLGARGRDDFFGEGLVDAGEAVSEAMQTVEIVDNTAPSVVFTSPADLSTVTGYVRASVTAFDNLEVADVVLSLDGVPFATDTATPFSFVVNASDLENGVHTLTAVASDSSGNMSTSARVRIRVTGGSGASSGSGGSSAADGDDIAPEAVINFPTDGSRVFSSVGLQATLTDNSALRRVEWLVDGVRVESSTLTGTRQTVSFLWNAGTALRGSHTVTVRVEDSSRNISTTSITLVKE